MPKVNQKAEQAHQAALSARQQAEAEAKRIEEQQKVNRLHHQVEMLQKNAKETAKSIETLKDEKDSMAKSVDKMTIKLKQAVKTADNKDKNHAEETQNLRQELAETKDEFDKMRIDHDILQSQSSIDTEDLQTIRAVASKLSSQLQFTKHKISLLLAISGVFWDDPDHAANRRSLGFTSTIHRNQASDHILRTSGKVGKAANMILSSTNRSSSSVQFGKPRSLSPPPAPSSPSSGEDNEIDPRMVFRSTFGSTFFPLPPIVPNGVTMALKKDAGISKRSKRKHQQSPSKSATLPAVIAPKMTVFDQRSPYTGGLIHNEQQLTTWSGAVRSSPNSPFLRGVLPDGKLSLQRPCETLRSRFDLAAHRTRLKETSASAKLWGSIIGGGSSRNKPPRKKSPSGSMMAGSSKSFGSSYVY